MNGQIYRQTPALLVGDLAHRFLQNWEFTGDVKDFERKLHDFIDHALAAGIRILPPGDRIRAPRDLCAASFARKPTPNSPSARILGREVPLLMPWNGQIMEGVIDLIYEKNGLLYLADYKTDRDRSK